MDKLSTRAKWIGGRLSQVTIKKVEKQYRHYYSFCRVCFHTIHDMNEDIYEYQGHNGNRSIYWSVCQACHEAITNYDYTKHAKLHTKEFKDAMESFKEKLRRVNH